MLPPTLVLLRQSRNLIRRTRLPRYSPAVRSFTSSHIRHNAEPIAIEPARDTEAFVRHVRSKWGDHLPQNLLSDVEYAIYERNYGEPVRLLSEEDLTALAEEAAAEAQQIEDSLEAIPVVRGPEMTWEEENQKSDRALEADEESVEIEAESEEQAWALKMVEEDMQRALKSTEEPEEDEDSGEPEWQRVHPLTRLGQFSTRPYTIPTPAYIRKPTQALLSDVSNKHIDNTCNKKFGPGFVNSPIMKRGRAKSSTSIPLHPSDTFMSEMEANAFLAAVLPGYYAQSMSALTEVRRRLGGDWVLGGGEEPGVKNVLDIGTGGAAILAWRDVIRAQQALKEDEDAVRTGIPKVDIPPSTEEIAAPGGIKATVVTSSNSLRHRMTKFLDNTQFIPRLPDAVQEGEYNARQPRKLYDLIISTNNFLTIPHHKSRKPILDSLWSLLNPNGGVLILIEKGTPAGFEAIAGARSYLLENHIPSPLNDPSRPAPTTPSHIVAPCTNHSQCPMYAHGDSIGSRRDYCHFTQRYERPPYLQRIVSANKSNHEDLHYSFVSIRRGVPLRVNPPEQTPESGDFDLTKSFPSIAQTVHSMDTLRAHAHTLPRVILPPLKRHGHVILDVCTPDAKIERWTVPRSFSKTAYRDARKSQWGDLWALSAKTKILRNLSLGDKKKAPKKKVIRTSDLAEGKATEKVIELDKPGGKKKNPGKRKKDRMMIEKQVRKTREELEMENEEKLAENMWKTRDEIEKDLWTEGEGTRWKEVKKETEEELDEIMELEEALREAHRRGGRSF